MTLSWEQGATWCHFFATTRLCFFPPWNTVVKNLEVNLTSDKFACRSLAKNLLLRLVHGRPLHRGGGQSRASARNLVALLNGSFLPLSNFFGFTSLEEDNIWMESISVENCSLVEVIVLFSSFMRTLGFKVRGENWFGSKTDLYVMYVCNLIHGQ